MMHFRPQGHDLAVCGAGGAATSTRYRPTVTCEECLFVLDPESEEKKLLDLAPVSGGYCPTCGHRNVHWPGCPEVKAS